MALTFGAATSDAVDIGSGSSIDDIPGVNPGTLLAWVRFTTFTSNRGLYQKFSGGSTNFRISGTAGDVQFACTRATTITSYITNNTPLVLNQWGFVAVTYDVAATPTTHIYGGSLTAAATECTYGTAQDGSGAVSTNAAANGKIGNNGGTSAAMQGDYATFAIYNRVLSLTEIIDWQFNRRPGSGCVAYYELGYNGTGTQFDLSGNGNNGTVTGATQATNGHVPTRAPFRRRIQYVPVVVTAASGGAVSATIPALSSLSTVIGVRRSVTATIAAVSTAAIALAARRPLSATVPATSAVAAAVAVRRLIAATIAAQSAVSATPAARRALLSTVTATSTMTVTLGKISAGNGVSAAMACTSSVTARVGIRRAVTFTAAATSALSVTMRARVALAASALGSSSVNITATVRRSVLMSATATSSMSASLNQAVVVVATPATGKYKSEHDSARLDIAAARGFSNEHRSAFSDLFKAGG